MTGVLVTGFEPFGVHEVNPSALIAEALEGVVLPVSFARASGALRDAIDEREPELVVCFGLADGDRAISVERFAHNLDEADAVDNEGAGGSGAEIDPTGPLALRSTLPVDAIVAALRAEEIPAGVSRDAGGYLCNHIFYVLMGMLGSGQRGGFVHVPGLDVLPLDGQLRAARTIMAVAST
ncbi:MAG: pyroglutamyl-peptidase [Gaiellaceae bacterium]|jgi:pyroglutamyl-peptidase|nr:pyroglutamyl-peptidase [Gaiellaceae bacterium]